MRTSNSNVSSPTNTGGLSTTAMVKIQVTDINDNAPIFYPRSYNVSLLDTPPIRTGTPIISVVASDADAGEFGRIAYSIVSGNELGIFTLRSDTGALSVVRPSMLAGKAAQRKHRLNVSAVDGGGLRAEQPAEVYISVIDATQMLLPVFGQQLYGYRVREDATVGTKVGTVQAGKFPMSDDNCHDD